MILSLQDKTTASDALKRGGAFARMSEGTSGSNANGWRRLAYVANVAHPLPVVSSVLEASLSIFGGRPAFAQAGSRMFSALSSLDPSATQEGGP